MSKEKNKKTVPSPQEFFEWKVNQICNEKDPSKLKRYKNITYEEYCIMYQKD